jgi:hypothetical protein
MANLSPLLGEERKSDFGAVRSVDDPCGHSEDVDFDPCDPRQLPSQK